MLADNYNPPNKSAGFTLTELLVGFAISLFIASVSLTYLVSSSQLFTSQTNDDIIQENARYALELVTQQFRLAGLDPLGELTSQLDVILNSNFCAAADSGVAEGVAPNGGQVCTRDGDAAAGGAGFVSDRFGIDYKVIAPTTTCGGQDITQTMIINSGGTLTVASVFWVQDAPNRNGVRSLYCQTFDKETNTTIGPAVPLIDGVDAMQVQYGRDTDGDGVVNSYANYNELVSANLANPMIATKEVRLVRIAMLISSGLDAGADRASASDTYDAENKVYQLLDQGGMAINSDRVLRQVYSTTLLIPNTEGVRDDA